MIPVSGKFFLRHHGSSGTLGEFSVRMYASVNSFVLFGGLCLPCCPFLISGATSQRFALASLESTGHLRGKLVDFDKSGTTAGSHLVQAYRHSRSRGPWAQTILCARRYPVLSDTV